MSSILVESQHSLASYATSVLGFPVVEEVVFRLLLLSGLRYIFSMLPDRSTNAGPFKRTLTPWNILTSLCFAVCHLDLETMEFSDSYLANTSQGRACLAKCLTLVFHAFFGSLFLLGPIYEKHGIFASIGYHSAWNAAAEAPKVRVMVLATQIYRLLEEGEEFHWKSFSFAKLFMNSTFLS